MFPRLRDGGTFEKTVAFYEPSGRDLCAPGDGRGDGVVAAPVGTFLIPVGEGEALFVTLPAGSGHSQPRR